MKTISLLLLFVCLTSVAQIKGNRNIVTKEFDVESIEKIKINLYAKVNIDQTQPNKLMITADGNLLQYIKKDVQNGTLHLDQIEWISASQGIVINIGAPNLERVEQGTHESTTIKVNNDFLNVLAPIGNVKITGTTKELRLGAELGTIDASKINAEKVFVNLWSRGTIIVNAIISLWAEVTDDGKLIYTNKPEKFDVSTKKDGKIMAYGQKIDLKNPEAKFIKFKIKNNSLNRNNFCVVGPKQDGSKFSYGFPMMLNSKRDENWTVGTRIFKVNKLGLRQFLVEITAVDEGRIVDLF